MPKSTRPSMTPLDGDEFLAENRRKREEAKDEAARKAARDDGDGDAGEIAGDRGAEVAPAAPSGVVTGRRRNWLIPALISVIVVLAGLVGWLGYEYAQDRDTSSTVSDTQRTEAMETARRYATQLATYDQANYADLDKRIRAISTPEFAKTYIAASADARRGNTAAKGKSTAVSNDAGLVSITDDKAVVLATLDQTVTSPEVAADVPDGIPYGSRVRVTLERHDGRWLLAGLDTV